MRFGRLSGYLIRFLTTEKETKTRWRELNCHKERGEWVEKGEQKRKPEINEERLPELLKKKKKRKKKKKEEKEKEKE